MEFTQSPLRSMMTATVLPRGYHFHPTDEQLISYYLKMKVEGKSIPAIPDMAMEEVELYGLSETKEPWKLFREVSTANVSFYVFSKLETTSRSGKKIKRVVGRGTWDLQNTHEVFRSDDPNKTVIGLKRMFRFEVKKEKVPRWIMHEYTLSGVPNYALCEIKNIVPDKEVHQDRGSDHLDLGEYLKRKRSGSVCGDDRGKRVRVDNVPATDSFGADIDIDGNSSFAAPTHDQGSDVGGSQFQLPLTEGGAEEETRELPGTDNNGDGVLNVPQEPFPLLGDRGDEFAWFFDDIEILLPLPETDIDIGGNSSFSAPTHDQGSDVVGSQFQSPLTNGGAEEETRELPGADNNGDGVLNVPQDPFPLLGDSGDEFAWFFDNMYVEGLLPLPETDIDALLLPSNITTDTDPAAFMFDPQPCSAPSLDSTHYDLQQQQGVCQ